MLKKSLSFDDVLIVPKFSNVKSRKDVNTRVGFLGLQVLPVVSSNMASVTEVNMAKAMRSAGAIGALHRFMSIEDNVRMYESSPQETLVSIGLGDVELERAAALYRVGARRFIIDVAHGAHMEVVRQTKALRHIIGKDGYIVVGNFATAQSVKDFKYFLGETKIDAIKVGIGGGGSCVTRMVTGCGLPTLASVLDCSELGLPIIADGGVRNSGDIAKALAAGATVVMCGRILAGSNESSAEVDSQFKIYSGSASMESYEAQGKGASHRTPEGESFLVPLTGSVFNTIQTLESGLRSAMSYVGVTNLHDFRECAELVEVTGHGKLESEAHGKHSRF